MVTWSFLPFAVNVSLNLSNVESEENRMLGASRLTKSSSGQNYKFTDHLVLYI